MKSPACNSFDLHFPGGLARPATITVLAARRSPSASARAGRLAGISAASGIIMVTFTTLSNPMSVSDTMPEYIPTVRYTQFQFLCNPTDRSASNVLHGSCLRGCAPWPGIHCLRHFNQANFSRNGACTMKSALTLILALGVLAMSSLAFGGESSDSATQVRYKTQRVDGVPRQNSVRLLIQQYRSLSFEDNLR
jgi:hypothetical protein